MKVLYGRGYRNFAITMGPRFTREEKGGDIISKKSLGAVNTVVEFLKENVQEQGLFRHWGREHTRRRILISIQRGDRITIRQLMEGSVLECAAALLIFLMNLRQPIIPIRVQKLVLAENRGIPERTVARDALGLLKQDLSGRHLDLLICLLDLLYVATKNSDSTELHGSQLPIMMLPVFFDLKPKDISRWKQAASTFNEIIISAPFLLREYDPESRTLGIIPDISEQEIALYRRLIDPNPDHNGTETFWGNRIPRNPDEEIHTDGVVRAILPLFLQVQSRLHPLLRTQ